MVCSTSGSPDIDDADNDGVNSLDNKKSNDDNVFRWTGVGTCRLDDDDDCDDKNCNANNKGMMTMYITGEPVWATAGSTGWAERANSEHPLWFESSSSQWSSPSSSSQLSYDYRHYHPDNCHSDERAARGGDVPAWVLGQLQSRPP